MVALIIVALIEAAVVVATIWFCSKEQRGSAGRALGLLNDQLTERKRLHRELENAMKGMVKIEVLAFNVKQIRELQDQIKSEQGRIVITQTELDTVETRLRELEEIEKELEASGVDIQEELNELKAREDELRSKNELLKSQIQESLKHIEELLGEIELSVQVVEHVKLMKTQLLSAEDNIEKLIVQIEETNAQYVDIKRRYDALDIEYAQLYEKFSNLDNDPEIRA